MKYYNYMKVADSENNKKPFHAQLFMEASDGDIYMVDYSNQHQILKSANKGVSWTTITTESNNIVAFWYDRTNEYLYYLQPTPLVKYVRLSDDVCIQPSISYFTNPEYQDVIVISGDPKCVGLYYSGEGNLGVGLSYLGASGLIGYLIVGSGGNTKYQMSFGVIHNSLFYFLWEAPGYLEGVKFAHTTYTFPGSCSSDKSCGTDKQLPPHAQRSIGYDGSYFYFTLEKGTREEFTITAVVPTSIADGTYINCTGLERNAYGEVITHNYYIWFDKVGDSSGDPAPVGRTAIRVDISGASTAQNVSDAIESALNSHYYFAADNAGGLTTTIKVIYFGNVTDVADYNSGLSVSVSTQGINASQYLYRLKISDWVLVELAPYDLIIMNDRFPAPTEREKAFSRSIKKIYQISAQKGVFDLIANLPGMDAVAQAISDNFIITSDATPQIWERVDMTTAIVMCDIEHNKQDYQRAKLLVNSDKISIVSKLYMILYHDVTYNGSTTEKVAFKGRVIDYEESKARIVTLNNPAAEIDDISPKGEYSGRTDEIIENLLIDWAAFITKGVFSTGKAMGTVKFEGDKSLRTILDNFAADDKFIWMIDPDGKLYYNAGTVDSGKDISQADKVIIINSYHPNKGVNRVEVNGGYVSGTPISGEWNDYEDQLINGVILFTYTDMNILTTALANDKAQQLGLRESATPLSLELLYYSVSLILAGQEITFVYDSNEYDLPSEQYKIEKVLYSIHEKVMKLTVSNGLVFIREKTQQIEQRVQENSQAIAQVAATAAAGTDANAIHKNVSAEISTITEKTTPVSADLYIMEDSAAANAKKRIQHSNILNDAFKKSTTGEINALTNKASPVAADIVVIEDSATSYAKKKIQIGNFCELSKDLSPQLGADLDLNGKSILVNGTLTSNQDFEGFVLDNITNAVSFGYAVYISSANTVSACDKDSIYLAIGLSVGTGKVLIQGTIKNTSWNWASYIGKPIYVGDSGALTADISAYATGDMVQVVGVAIDTYSILVKGIDWVEVA